MTKAHFIDWTRDDEAETDITVEYTISGGCSAHYGDMNYPGHPAEAPEVEIVGAWVKPAPGSFIVKGIGEVTLTDAEAEKIRDYIIENHEDDGDDPDYARERRAEEQRDDDLTSGDPDD